ncbi:hypothetical protein PR202_ga29246 [Eleusine coracana subsp. coracana]|uniref:Sulfotransferase n=1 Tax=Eleusine coracana subsp. coracana TaxID=191504 RepID=A0AAV5DMF7_ELECO|nr:hypothetical protein QOZ80_7AG0576370 [Eleusine coracana subsp. coracana]GJN11080.1 hypothetical protein PR202_ga29246 [Eleusine coracana subsp. coracana]
MATTNAPAPAALGPVPFRDLCGVRPVSDVTTRSADNKLWLQRYQGTWVLESWVPGIMAIQRSFVPRRGDVVLGSPPKCGTTWLKALAFANMSRAAYPPAHPEHPLLRLNPHDCVPFMELLFATGTRKESKMNALPSPRLMNTHMQHSILPASVTTDQNLDCKIVYICREPKDMLVSLWHYTRRALPDVSSFLDVFEPACEGKCLCGPIWDHVLGYWNASKASPEKVLFLRYEDLLSDPVENVRKLARFVGQPFSVSEEEAGVLMDIVRLCSFDKLKNLEVNSADPSSDFANDWYFRKGEVGDWANHMTPDMARRLDAIVEEKLSGSGLSFL